MIVEKAKRGRGFTLTEILIAAAVVLVLLVLLAPTLKQNRHEAATVRQSGITTTLARIERAKALFAADKHLANGAPVTLADLLRTGYLREGDGSGGPPGVRYIVGPVGTPVSFTYDSDHGAVSTAPAASSSTTPAAR